MADEAPEIRQSRSRPTFGVLASGQRVTISHMVHGRRAEEPGLVTEFRFVGGEPCVVEVLEGEWTTRGIQPELLGTLTLSSDDVRRLDGLLAAYRSDPPASGCADLDRVDITWHGGGVEPNEYESFAGASSRIGDTEACLTLSSLARRLSANGPRRRPPA